jgi:hypothetical protein
VRKGRGTPPTIQKKKEEEYEEGFSAVPVLPITFMSLAERREVTVISRPWSSFAASQSTENANIIDCM